MQSSYLLTKEACPKCRSQGKDGTGDNLAIYSDGHKFCFSCGYYQAAPQTIDSVRCKLTQGESVTNGVKSRIKTCDPLPFDITSVLPPPAKRWLLGYGLTFSDMQKFWWSDSMAQLIYPVFDTEGQLLLWQGRSFDPEKLLRKQKYFTSGPVNDHFHFIHWNESMKSSQCVIVEDVVSAIKVGRVYTGMPLFGSHLSQQRLIQMRDYVLPMTFKFASKTIGIWLDPDKLSYANKLKNQAQELGLNAFVISTKQDPKYYTHTEMKEYIRNGAMHYANT